MSERSLKRKVLHALIAGLVVCVIAFTVGITFQFSVFLHSTGLCHNLFIDTLFSCMDYPDIKLMILSAGLSVLLLLGIVYLYSTRAAAIILATLYSALLFMVFVFRFLLPGYAGTGDPNLIPFKSIAVYLSGEPSWIAWDNLVHNIWPFALLGAILPFTTKQLLTIRAVALVSVAIGATVEIMQSLLGTGIFDIDDIMLNALGIVVGYLAVSVVIRQRSFRKNHNEAQAANVQ